MVKLLSVTVEVKVPDCDSSIALSLRIYTFIYLRYEFPKLDLSTSQSIVPGGWTELRDKVGSPGSVTGAAVKSDRQTLARGGQWTLESVDAHGVLVW
ncbi:hypothetical protein RRG08_003561 [Elysia crispata]|uniref:Uncharacterized protein n=1 Tax=Elysia crispata TaxID=231223 RepID=A0AAE0Y6R0_9GAST|nr:hypothetical protein RRG08_003561 [Elysia crispata]